MHEHWTAIVAFGHRIWIETFGSFKAAEDWSIDIDFDECDGEASIRIIRTNTITHTPA